MNHIGRQFDVVSSMSSSYYHKWGSYMLLTWLHHWHDNFNLTLYSEDILPVDHPRVTVVPLDSFGKEYKGFLKAEHSNNRAPIFAKKAWPIMHHLKQNDGCLVWVDADVITESFIHSHWLNSLINDNFSAHLGVPQGEYYSVETGFFIINREHHMKNTFLEKYRNIYLNRDFSKMYKPFDGDTFGRVITECREIGLDYNELAPNPDKVLSPFNKRFKGKLWHLKGKHKEKEPLESPRLLAQLDKLPKVLPS